MIDNKSYDKNSIHVPNDDTLERAFTITKRWNFYCWFSYSAGSTSIVDMN